MNKFFLMGVCSLSLLAGCQQNETELEMGETGKIALRASVANSVASRTVTDAGGLSTTFEEGDEIGFFIPGEESQVKWSLTGDGWESEVPLTWENKVDEFEFCAYYPYSDGVTGRTSIPTPDLSRQNGRFSDIGLFDFLAARCTSSSSPKSFR